MSTSPNLHGLSDSAARSFDRLGPCPASGCIGGLVLDEVCERCDGEGRVAPSVTAMPQRAVDEVVCPEERAIRTALELARGTMRRSGYIGAYHVSSKAVGWWVGWSGNGSRRDIDRRALQEASVELLAVGFDAAVMPGFDRLPVDRGRWSEVGDERDGEAATLNAEPDESLIRECESGFATAAE